MRIRLSLILTLIIAMMTTSCNDEVFIDDLAVEPANISLDWEGGDAIFKANQSLDHAFIIAYRWVNGRGKPLGDEGMTYTLTRNSGRDIYNDLCRLRLTLKDNYLSVNCLNNFYPDTLYMHIDLSDEYETKQTNLRILPSPGFTPGQIAYTLSYWYGREYNDTIPLMSLSNINQIPVTINPLAAGDTIATKTGTFEPWRQLLSDNIFGRTPIKVPGVDFSFASMNPVESTDSVVYNALPHTLKGNAIICKEDVSIEMPPETFCSVSVVVKHEEAGFTYDIPAYNPAGGETVSVDGIYWINCPLSYEIITDISSIVHQ